MKEWVRFSRSSGRYSRQAHTDIPASCFEREVGREGFFGPSSHIYHKHAPTSWQSIDGPLAPHAFDLESLWASGCSPSDANLLFKNPSCRVLSWFINKPMDHLFRNADGDLLLFIHRGEGDLYCDFGHMAFRDGDYLLIPRGTLWRLDNVTDCQILMIEATNSAFQFPQKGMLGEQAIFDSEVLESPVIDDAFKAQWSEDEWQVRIQCRHQLTQMTYPFNPLDAEGWKGTLTVLKLNWRDLRPIMSHRYHLPPSVHTTFVADGFVISTFVPRPIESDPGALKVPFYHSNCDYDELIFYHAGDFFSRDNIAPGMCTLHPAGFPHGPHPKAYKASLTKPQKNTEEVALMVDTRLPLDICDAALAGEVDGYVNSWREDKSEL